MGRSLCKTSGRIAEAARTAAASKTTIARLEEDLAAQVTSAAQALADCDTAQSTAELAALRRAMLVARATVDAAAAANAIFELG